MTATENLLSVVGPPGTGKTTYLVKQIGRAAEKFSREGVLVASFTRAAAKEIADRAGTAALKSNVGTLHALCFRYLGHPILTQTPEIIQAWNETQPPAYQLKGAEKLDDVAVTPQSKGGDALLQQLDVYRAKRVREEMWPLRVVQFAKQWRDFKQQTESFDFTDLVETALLEQAKPPSSVKVAFYDESQDFTRLEADLARFWASELEHAVFAGDPDQCLYAFKGADPNAMLRGISDDRRRVLSQSYRVPQEPHAAAVRWVSRLNSREFEPLYHPTTEKGKVVQSRATWQNPRPLLEPLIEEVEAGRRVMILVSAGYLLAPVLKMLRAEGIPYHNDYKLDRYDWNPLHTSEDKTSTVDRLLAFLRPRAGVWKEPEMWTPRDLKLWTALVKSKEAGLRHGAKTEIQRLVEDPYYGSAPMSVERLLDLFEEEGLSEALVADPEWLVKAALAGKKGALEYPTNILQKRGADALRNQPQVVVGTIHSVKGGEADHVMLFPDLSPAAYREWWGGGDKKDAVIRAFYVALTRTKDVVTVCQPAGSASVRQLGAK